MKKVLLTVIGLLACIAPSVAPARTLYTEGNLDFTRIQVVGHSSRLITRVPHFTIVGTAYGKEAAIQGAYSSQDQAVMNRCLGLAEQLGLSGAKRMLPIQVQPDPNLKGFSRIQYCTLYQQ